MPRPIALAKHIRHVDDGNHPAARENQNWLAEQIRQARESIAKWPEWMRRAAEHDASERPTE